MVGSSQFSFKSAGKVARPARGKVVLEPRRTMIAELRSMRRLEFLFSELNRVSGGYSQPYTTRFTHRGVINLQYIQFITTASM